MHNVVNKKANNRYYDYWLADGKFDVNSYDFKSANTAQNH